MFSIRHCLSLWGNFTESFESVIVREVLYQILLA